MCLGGQSQGEVGEGVGESSGSTYMFWILLITQFYYPDPLPHCVTVTV